MAPFSVTLNTPNPLSQILRSRHYLTLNISEIVQDRLFNYNGVLTGTYTCPTEGVFSNDLE